MKLQGLHHITMITGDARRNVAFYADTLGLRLVKKTVNFDQPHAYHLYFGDESGSPGSILTWFEFAGAAAGRAGAGMIHTLKLAGSSTAALRFWEARLQGRGVQTRAPDGALAFADPDGLALELVLAGDDPPPDTAGRQGSGTVHHIAWASRDEDHLDWQALVRDAGGHVTGVRDRDYFKAIYFREPRGILFEIATLSPGFAVDEDAERLGEQLRLPPQHEHLRAELERTLTPVVNPRAAQRATVS